jgi:hypothetical protein
VANHLQRFPAARLPEIREFIAENIGHDYTDRVADAMLNILDEEMLVSLRDDHIMETAERFMPPWTVDIEEGGILNLAGFISRIIDYKPVFTRRHSTQIATKRPPPKGGGFCSG